ncbi:MAG TPA: DNA methyltransferase [Candidatus Kapabacteria bacterium]|nr:DNA methyltransferase [Candidatus Kapabacteria bacterium]
MPDHTPVTRFIARWKASSASERSNYALFLTELCDVLGVPHPDPAGGRPDDDAYVIDRVINYTAADGTTAANFIDLYKRGCFVLEAKQGSWAAEDPGRALGNAPRRQRAGTARRATRGWDTAMLKARAQAEGYVRALPPEEGNPPFIVVADIGHCFDLYADFSRAGKLYLPFPDPHSQRIMLDDLERDDVRDLLRTLWTQPQELDPARRSARVTRDVADRLARLAKSLEGAGHPPEEVAAFLMRMIFTMFAEDVGLLPNRSFLEMLIRLKGREKILPDMLRSLWDTMAVGGFSPILEEKILKFNGGLFENTTALPLAPEQVELLIDAARADWHDVEPAIFGTLVERALDPVERHRLGAHYTPRAYVERLVIPTIVEPVREEWEASKATAIGHRNAGREREAVDELREFHRTLCTMRVLDPACGTGNFLYVTMDHLKRIEGEVLAMLEGVGKIDRTLELTELTVDPHQFLGMEINPRAAAIADLVLWIGYLQWHYRTHGDAQPREPVLRRYHNIECRDALMEYSGTEPVLDAAGAPVTRWDGRTTKLHPVTGEPVPDESAQVNVLRYINPRRAAWPQAEYIVGNPPFVANRNLRAALGDGYVNALNISYPEITDAVDLVMLFWWRAGIAVLTGNAIRFGFVTTNSIRMQQNQSVVTSILAGGASIVFAIPDHPWIDEIASAKVRIAMTVVVKKFNHTQAQLWISPDHDVVSSRAAINRDLTDSDFKRLTPISIPPDLSPLIDVSHLVDLKANSGLCHAGLKPYARSLIVDANNTSALIPDFDQRNRHLPPYRNGHDIGQRPRYVHVIDLFGLSEDEVRSRFPNLYQYLLTTVKPERSQERNPRLRSQWWLFEANRPELRAALSTLTRFIVTIENSPSQVFTFLDQGILPDQKLRVVCSDDALVLAILSTSVHKVFASRTGGHQGIANTLVYNSRCFNQFPFPDPSPELKGRIRELGERLDAHRKRQQELHPALTITGMYNVLEKLRSGEALSAKEKTIHEEGLVSVLRSIHDDLDTAVFAAYGWPSTLTDQEILERLVALNAERAREEAEGKIRWLRPEFQNPKGAPGIAQQFEGLVSEPVHAYAAGTKAGRAARGKGAQGKAAAKPAEKIPWPSSYREQTMAVRGALIAYGAPATATDIAARFKSARKARVEEILQTLAELGQIREVENMFTVAT